MGGQAVRKACMMLAVITALNSLRTPHAQKQSVQHDAAAAAATQDAGVNKAGYRIALLSDTHLIGPQYECCSESNAVDNESIMQTPQRFADVIDNVNAMQPQPHLAVFVGDVVHLGHLSRDLSWYSSTRNAFPIARDIFARLRAPLRLVWGNHDYKVKCGDEEQSYDRSFSHKLFATFFNEQPYGSHDVGPWRLLFLNGMLGDTWKWNSTQCFTRYSSYGAEQLQWLDEQLRQAKRSIIFVHHPLPVAFKHELGANSRLKDLVTVLTKHRHKIAHVFTGHYHRGCDWQESFPFPVTTLPAVRYDDDNYFLLKLSADGHHHEVVDWEKNRGGARCSETWRYDDDAPRRVPYAEEHGTCGLPHAVDTDTYHIDPIATIDDLPQDFNPDKSCAYVLTSPLLRDTCFAEAQHSAAEQQHNVTARQENMDACCAALDVLMSPTSSSPFATCLCQTDFWHSFKEQATRAGKNAVDILTSCVHAGSPLQFYGTFGGHCKGGVIPPGATARCQSIVCRMLSAMQQRKAMFVLPGLAAIAAWVACMLAAMRRSQAR